MGGRIGRQRILFDLWGDTVNTAAARIIAGAASGESSSYPSPNRSLPPPVTRSRARGEHQLKGFRGPVELYAIETRPGVPS